MESVVNTYIGIGSLGISNPKIIYSDNMANFNFQTQP